MKCAEFENRLNLALDQRQRPEWDAEIRLHCENCPGCRDLAASYSVLLDGFYALTTPEPPANLSIRVVDELRTQPSTARRATLVAMLLATAATALFAVPLWQMNRSSDAPTKRSGSVALSTTLSNGQAAGWNEIDTLPVVGPVLVSMSDDDETTDPYAELAKGTGQGLANVVLYIPSIGNSTPGMMAPGSVVRGEQTWPQRMSQGFRPVTESVNETLDLLLEALPTSLPASRS